VRELVGGMIRGGGQDLGLEFKIERRKDKRDRIKTKGDRIERRKDKRGKKRR